MSSTKYRVPLPPHLIPFSSQQGVELFHEALHDGGAKPFFKLIEQFHTQNEPAFCGLGTLSMVLNALQIDPNRMWKGPWRWYSEELLDCCVPLETVRESGITAPQFRCLARCNNAKCDLFYGSEVTVQQFRDHLYQITHEFKPDDPQFMIVSYDRKSLQQTGVGHFSPIAVYHQKRDMVLVLDVARFKYPPYFVSVEEMFASLQPLDESTGKSRGYFLMGRTAKPVSPIFAKVLCTSEQLLQFKKTTEERFHELELANPQTIEQLAKWVEPFVTIATSFRVMGSIVQLEENDTVLVYDSLNKEHREQVQSLFQKVKQLCVYPLILDHVKSEVQAVLYSLLFTAYHMGHLMPSNIKTRWDLLQKAIVEDQSLLYEVKAVQSQIQALLALCAD